MKLFDPAAPGPVPLPPPRPPRKKHPRCRCGCKRAARWPRDGDPVFATRLCGYKVAVRLEREGMMPETF